MLSNFSFLSLFLVFIFILSSCSDSNYIYTKDIEESDDKKLVVYKSFFGNFVVSVVSNLGEEMELFTSDSRDYFKINPYSERIAILESINLNDMGNSVLRVMKYNGDFNKDWFVNTYHRYTEEVENSETGKTETKYKGFRRNCDISGIGWVSEDVLRANLSCNFVHDGDTFYFGDTGTSIGYIKDFKSGDYEIKFDEFNKILSIDFIDLLTDDKL